VAAGETAKEPEAPKKDGYKFGGWYADSALTSLFSFAAKIEKDITLYAKWIDDSVPTYKVTVNPITNGTVTATPSAGVAEGAEVTLEIKPDPGYVLDTLTVDGANKTADVAAGKYTFTMPASNVTVSATFKSIYSTGLVGDIVLSDGKYITAENYTKYKSIVDASNETAIAVIFDETNKLGLGLVQGTNRAWAQSGKTGYTNKITGLVCTPTGNNASTATFSGVTDGRQSLDTFKDFVENNSNDYSDANYPAWYWIENYAATAGLTGAYASGWYIPSVKELCDLYKVKDVVNNSIQKVGGTQLFTSYSTSGYAIWYWSSSQSLSGSADASADASAWNVSFETGAITSGHKTHTNTASAVRAFN
ncbi:MAG: InlB B-repeat-containing protein, partial [Treponema sp.]|nr:InlB B-repeat-containing protein [Treponema sp.]